MPEPIRTGPGPPPGCGPRRDCQHRLSAAVFARASALGHGGRDRDLEPSRDDPRVASGLGLAASTGAGPRTRGRVGLCRRRARQSAIWTPPSPRTWTSSAPRPTPRHGRTVSSTPPCCRPACWPTSTTRARTTRTTDAGPMGALRDDRSASLLHDGGRRRHRASRPDLHGGVERQGVVEVGHDAPVQLRAVAPQTPRHRDLRAHRRIVALANRANDGLRASLDSW